MSTLFVAAHNASKLSKRGADYICDGKTDSAKLAEALGSMPQGGTLELSEGDFGLTQPLRYPEQCVQIVGQGALSCAEETQATRLRFSFEGLDSCVVFAPLCVGQGLRDLALLGDGETTRYGILLQSGAALKEMQFVNVTGMTVAGVRGDSGNSQNYLERVLTRNLDRGFWMYGNNNTYVACQSMRSSVLDRMDQGWGFRSQETGALYLSCVAENLAVGFEIAAYAEGSTLQGCFAEKCGCGLVIGGTPEPRAIRADSFSSIVSQDRERGAIRVGSSMGTTLRQLYVRDSASGISVEIAETAKTMSVSGVLDDTTPILNRAGDMVRVENVSHAGHWLSVA